MAANTSPLITSVGMAKMMEYVVNIFLILILMQWFCCIKVRVIKTQRVWECAPSKTEVTIWETLASPNWFSVILNATQIQTVTHKVCNIWRLFMIIKTAYTKEVIITTSISWCNNAAYSSISFPDSCLFSDQVHGCCLLSFNTFCSDSGIFCLPNTNSLPLYFISSSYFFFGENRPS